MGNQKGLAGGKDVIGARIRGLLASPGDKGRVQNAEPTEARIREKHGEALSVSICGGTLPRATRTLVFDPPCRTRLSPAGSETGVPCAPEKCSQPAQILIGAGKATRNRPKPPTSESRRQNAERRTAWQSHPKPRKRESIRENAECGNAGQSRPDRRAAPRILRHIPGASVV